MEVGPPWCYEEVVRQMVFTGRFRGHWCAFASVYAWSIWAENFWHCPVSPCVWEVAQDCHQILSFFRGIHSVNHMKLRSLFGSSGNRTIHFAVKFRMTDWFSPLDTEAHMYQSLVDRNGTGSACSFPTSMTPGEANSKLRATDRHKWCDPKKTKLDLLEKCWEQCHSAPYIWRAIWEIDGDGFASERLWNSNHRLKSVLFEIHLDFLWSFHDLLFGTWFEFIWF
jgi:hypothetical protein